MPAWTPQDTSRGPLGDEIRASPPVLTVDSPGLVCVSDTQAEHERFPQHRPRLPGSLGLQLAVGAWPPSDLGSSTQAGFQPLYPGASTLSTVALAQKLGGGWLLGTNTGSKLQPVQRGHGLLGMGKGCPWRCEQVLLGGTALVAAPGLSDADRGSSHHRTARLPPPVGPAWKLRGAGAPAPWG